jgi:hypothetical protein
MIMLFLMQSDTYLKYYCLNTGADGKTPMFKRSVKEKYFDTIDSRWST